MEQRQARIRGFLDKEVSIAVLLAAAEFEWSVRRAIITLGKSPNVLVRKTLESCSGLERYKRVWQEEVAGHRGVPLAEIIPDWQRFQKSAFPLRSSLIHGVRGNVERSYGAEQVECILAATRAVGEYARRAGFEITEKLPVRKCCSKCGR